MTRSLYRRWADRLLQRDRPADRTAASMEDDGRLVAGLRAGDEAVFSELVDRYGGTMLRVALVYVPAPALAEEVVQETWLAVLRGIDRFEGRSSLRTWIFRILVNRARSVAVAESRSSPLSALTAGDGGPSVDPDRFVPGQGAWASPPRGWSEDPEERVLAAELLRLVREALETATPAQRAVVLLRDVHGFSGEEVCDLLDLTSSNQRVLLHRGRSRVRALLEDYVRGRSGVRE